VGKGIWAQDFLALLLWKDENELYEIMSEIGLEPEIHTDIDKVNTWQYADGVPNPVNPFECLVNGIKCWLEISKDKEIERMSLSFIDEHQLEDLNDYFFERAKLLEKFLKSKNFTCK